MSVMENQGNIPAASAKDDKPDIDDEALKDLIALRQKCPRFRILVIGKANAGKTTILQKMCNTSDAPIIHDQHGNEVDPSVINPTDGRGIHDINHEMTFSSNPSFVFHDSRGFEANSSEEIASVRKFIAERAASNDLTSQLHAIWYCLPADNHRPLSKAEMTFFAAGTDTGKVPVIAIFTKFDGLEVKEYAKLREEGKSLREAKRLAPALADKFFRESDYFLKKLEKVDHPPATYLCLRDMHKETSSCAELTECTMNALDNKTLKLLFVTVQQNNIQLCTEYCIKSYIMPKLIEVSLNSVFLTEKVMTEMVLCVLLYHPHSWGENYENKPDEDDLGHHGRHAGHGGVHYAAGYAYYSGYRILYLDDYEPILQPVLHTLAGLPTGFLPILRVCTAGLIFARTSHWLMQENPEINFKEGFKLAVSNYKESGRLNSIREAVDRAFPFLRFGGVREDDTEVTHKVMEIVKEFVAV